MFQVIFRFSDWILIKQIIISSIYFRCWGKQIFERMLPGGGGGWGGAGRFSNFLLSGAWWQELGGEFWVGEAWVKMPRINAFTRNLNSINLGIFPTHGGIEKFERKFKKHSGERDKALGSWCILVSKDVSLRLILKDKGGNQDCLPLCWF